MYTEQRMGVGRPSILCMYIQSIGWMVRRPSILCIYTEHRMGVRRPSILYMYAEHRMEG